MLLTKQSQLPLLNSIVIDANDNLCHLATVHHCFFNAGGNTTSPAEQVNKHYFIIQRIFYSSLYQFATA